ncbi:MAG: DUF1461 domain-containing protein [Nanoarchaeota archaeon]|nr:DUF1461 domain-containing protein [Nanoarchaeota archaeon]
MKKIKRKVFLVVFIILIPILLFIANGLFIFNNGLKDDQEMYNFFKSNEELSSTYSEREIMHLQEVKELIQSLTATLRLGLLLFALMSLSLYIKNKKDFAKGLFYGGNLTILLLIIFLIIFLINFQFFFTTFHKLLFKTDYWLLESGSKLLQQFPLEFWVQGFRNLFVYIFVESLIISSLGYLIKKRKKLSTFK